MNKIIRVLVLYVALCFVFVHTALADTATASSATMTIFDDVVHVLGSALAIALMGLVTLGVQKLAQKWHLQVPQEWQSKINDSIDHGIAYAEEQAHKAAAASPLVGDAKLNLATGYVLNLVGDDKKLRDLGEAKLKQMIEARLSLSRASEPPMPALPDQASSAPAASAPPLAPTSAAAATAAKVVPMLAALILGAMMFAGCTAGAREKALSVSSSTVGAAGSIFLVYDHQREQDCVTQNPTRDGYDACIAAYHAKRKKVDDSLAALKAAVVVAKAKLDDKSLADIAAAALSFEQAVATLKEDVK